MALAAEAPVDADWPDVAAFDFAEVSVTVVVLAPADELAAEAPVFDPPAEAALAAELELCLVVVSVVFVAVLAEAAPDPEETAPPKPDGAPEEALDDDTFVDLVADEELAEAELTPPAEALVELKPPRLDPSEAADETLDPEA